ncbi:portal protein [Gordonia phage CherryonLim]|uniref:Portal protein n=1 Tax=Gordonia phage CherryonLim TaxID=2652411 RepID=A0A5P8DBK5_9CAUD|nr:portal protein [Gordonia phage CherryonLim]QFP95759.1 portal protein [Gordonia phage CherryonLim]
MTVNKNYSKLMQGLDAHLVDNQRADTYYEGTQQVPKLNIAVPPLLHGIETVVGWPATCVDVLHERLDFRGYDMDAKYQSIIQKIVDDNQLIYESELGHLDSLLYGIAFGVIGSGDTKIGEPEIVVNVESAKTMTGIYNRRKRRMEVAASKGFEDGEWLTGALYEEYKTTYYRRATSTSRWKVEHVDNHNLGRVPVVRLANRCRAGRTYGKSEVTKAVRSYTNMGIRTLMGMEVNREFFSAPQRYVLGAREEQFTDDQGRPIPGWRAIMGSLWNLERDEEWVNDHPNSEGLPTVGQFPANPPGPFIEQLEGLSKMFAAEVGIPPNYLGFTTENPPSGDAIRALESRLIKRAERRISGWDPAWKELAQLAIYMKSGEAPPLGDMVTVWRDPGTPSQSADADRAVKLIGAGVLPATSSVTHEMVGFTPSQIKRIQRDQTKQAMMDILRGGANGNGGTQSAGAAEPAGADSGSGNQRTAESVA